MDNQLYDEGQHYEKDIENYWGGLWKTKNQTFDFDDAMSRFKFRTVIKPVLDQLPHNAKICEVGVGLGNWLYLSKSYRPDLQLYGADLSDFSVDYCNSNGINCVKADTRNLPFATDEFDAVFSWGVVEHMLDSHVAVSEQFRITKKWLSFDVPYQHSPAHLTTKRATRRRALSDYEFMVEFGRFFDKNSFNELLNSSIKTEFSAKIHNNYLVLPGRFRAMEKFIPDAIRKALGSNIGATICK